MASDTHYPTQGGNAPKYGVIVFVDIEDFSLHAPAWQCDAVRKLWAFVISDEDRHGCKIVRNETGDGMLLVFEDPHKLGFRKVLEIIDRWIEYMKTGTQTVHMRAAVHCGFYNLLSPQNRTRDPIIIGTDVNHCARLVTIGDAGHIVVSDEFVTKWCEWGLNPDGLRPPLDEEPPEYEVKHRVRIKFRFWDLKNANPAPKKYERSLIIIDVMFKTLAKIANGLNDQLKEAFPDLAAVNLGIRVTIYFPKSNSKRQVELVPHLRFSALDPEAPIQRLGTVYPLHGEDGGLLAKAFNEKEVKFVNNLPEVRSGDPSTLTAYIKHLKAETNLSEAKIKRFGNFPKAMIALPFGLTAANPEGILCLDFGSMVADLTLDACHKIKHKILEEHGVKLSLLLSS